MIRYSESFGYGGKNTLTNVSNYLTLVSVPAEDIKHALKGSSTFMPTHAPSEPALVGPIMPIMDQYCRTQSMSYKLSTNTKLS
jgi:hypothetical protein